MRAIDPPPAPIVCTSSDGNRTVNPPTSRCAAGAGDPSTMRHTSVEVPPMSKVTASGKPLAAATAAPARTPPAGPESSRAAGSSAASTAAMSPPAEVMTSTSSASSARPRRYDRQRGRSEALITVVTVRSYSRISGDTSCEQLTSRPRPRSTSATACSWPGSRSAWRRHTATAPTSSPTSAAGHRRHVERHQLGAVGRQPPGHLVAPLPGDEGLGPRRQLVVEGGPVLAGDLDDVGQALGGEQGDGRPPPFEQGVGGHGRAVRQHRGPRRRPATRRGPRAPPPPPGPGRRGWRAPSPTGRRRPPRR